MQCILAFGGEQSCSKESMEANTLRRRENVKYACGDVAMWRWEFEDDKCLI